MGESRQDGKLARLFDAGVAVAPPLTAEQLLEIPAKRGVFLLSGPAGEPILLATAADIRSRVRHRLAEAEGPAGKRADLRQIAAGVWWKLADSHFEMEWQYLRLARAIHPDTYPGLLGARQGWWVQVDPAEGVPAFRRTKAVYTRPGRYLGPFGDKHSAQRFIDILIDAFDLCRNEQILRRAPRGAGCVYAQMGRCCGYCEAPGRMDEYRRLLERVSQYAAGEREPARGEIDAEMRRLAADKQYEQAAACKARLDRLNELDADVFQHVADAGEFQYLLIQRGPSRQKAKVFLMDRGAIRPAGALDYPLKDKQLRRTISSMRSFAAKDRPFDQSQREGAALAAHYLFVAAERRGLAVRFDSDLTVELLAARMESAADGLRLRPRAVRTKKVSPTANDS